MARRKSPRIPDEMLDQLLSGAATLQGCDLGLQQLALEQHLAQPGLETLALQRLTISRSRGQARLTRRKEGIAPAA